MRFSREMKSIAYFLETQKGFNILQCVYVSDGITPADNERSSLSAAHYKKIDISDGIYVVNIGGYIGESTQLEIDYAKAHNKEIIYHCNK